MLRNWMRRIGQARIVALATIAVFTGGVLLESAEARVGRGRGGFSRSFGSRGSRTPDTGNPGSRMQPLGSARQPRNGINPQSNRGSWLQRNPLLGGLLGAVAGTMIGAMIMNAFGGMNGGGGIIMLLLMGGLALMLVMAALRFFKGRQQPNFAGNSNFGGNPGGNLFGGGLGNSGPLGGQNYGNANYGGFGGNQVDAPPANTQTREQGLAAIALEDPAMSNERLQDTLTTRFFQIQEAHSAGDRLALQTAATPEMYQEMARDLDELDRHQERNIIKNIVMRSFDITEAWQEGDVEFVTAHINARLLDYTERNGLVVSGDANTPTQFSEYWTFVRTRGRGDWQLSAINQEA